MTDDDELTPTTPTAPTGPTGPTAATPPPSTVPARRPDASMGLISDVISKALDPGYAEAAARPHVHRSPVRRLGRGGLDLLLAIALGVVSVVAVTQLRSPSLSGPDPRDVIDQQITERTAKADGLASDAELLSAEIAKIQTDAVAAVNPGLFEQLEDYELASGAIAVNGAGLVMVVDDSGVDPDDEAARVQDVDLQIVTNGLWAAGAEAIAVNGQRLTSLSAIRSAGQAILIDLNPLIAPYRIEVIGDAHELQTAFARSSAANHLAFLSGTYGITVTTTSEPELELPGVGNRTLQHAVPSGMATSAGKDEEKGTS